jgi:hypothetical protein
MAAADGVFNGPTEALTSTINVSSWTPGDHILSVRARDAAGKWSSPVTTTLKVAFDAIFADSFESGNFSAWSASTGRGLSVNAAARMGSGGALGMQAVISGTLPNYVTDNTPNNEPSYRARFYFNPNGADTLQLNRNILVGLNTAGANVFRVQYRGNSGAYQIRAVVSRAGGDTFSSFYSISNGPHAVEIAWNSAVNGSLSLYVDGVLQQTLAGIDTSAYRIDSVRLGPSLGFVVGSTGTEYYDAFVSTRTTYIGP